VSAPRNREQQALSQKQVQITFATELANSNVSVYTLMTLLGHESMVTSQRYVTAAGTETRTAAAQNKLYNLIPENRFAD
jgi:integrase/recombinase XerC